MKKVISIFIILLFSILIVGCTNVLIDNNDIQNQEKNDFDSLTVSVKLEHLSKKMKNANEENVEYTEEISELEEKIKNMSRKELGNLFVDCKSVAIKNLMIIAFDENLIIVVDQGTSFESIESVKIIKSVNPTAIELQKLKTDMNVGELVSIMGYPNIVTISEFNAFDYKLDNNESYRIKFDDKLFVTEISYIDYTRLPDPTKTTDENCDPEGKTPSSVTELIKIGMTFEEVVELIGKPNYTSGSGAIRYEWNLEDGTTLNINFSRKDYKNEILYVVRIDIR